jgi:hypothetical protein
MKLDNIKKQKIQKLMEKTYDDLVISLKEDDLNITIKEWLKQQLKPENYWDGIDCWISIIENELELYDDDYYTELFHIIKEFFENKYNK